MQHRFVLDLQEAQELGSALGYLLLYLELAAAYLGAPLLNQVRQSYCTDVRPDYAMLPSQPLCLGQAGGSH